MNYFNTFIHVADDCPARAASVPESRGGKKTAAVLHYELMAGEPYTRTQEDVLFETYAETRDIEPEARPSERERFFAKGQPCLRASPLGKLYGWGIHHDANGRVALYAVDSEDYRRLASDAGLRHLKAFRSKRA